MMETVNTDILIIGGGGAGSRAALSAKISNPNLDVTIATSGKYGFSGSTNFFASETLGINAPFNFMGDGDSPRVYEDDMIKTGMGLADKKLCGIISREATDRVCDLFDLGIKFDSGSDGKIKQKQLSGCTRSRSMSVDGKTGIEIVRVLKNANYKEEVRVIEDCRFVDLAVDENMVYGAIFITSRGTLLVNAKAFILATGGAGGIFELNVNPADICGRGFSAALKAGAKIINMEFIQIGPGVVYPSTKFIIHSYMWEFLPRLLNVKKEEFLPKYLPGNLRPADVIREKRYSFPFSCRTCAKYLDISIFKEITGGNATPNGGVYLDISHISVEKLIRNAYVIYDTFKKRGFDVSSQLLEIAPVVQSFNGGIFINEDGQTGISGLFAAGEASGGVHGADRPGGNNITDCQVFGHRAGIAASAFASGSGTNHRINHRLINLKIREIEKNITSSSSDDRKSTDILKKLYSRYLSIVRNKEGLVTVLNMTEDIIQRGARGDINTFSDLYNAALIGSAIAKSALLRNESRGSHYREDFPDMSSDFDKRITIMLKDASVSAEFEK